MSQADEASSTGAGAAASGKSGDLTNKVNVALFDPYSELDRVDTIASYLTALSGTIAEMADHLMMDADAKVNHLRSNVQVACQRMITLVAMQEELSRELHLVIQREYSGLHGMGVRANRRSA